MRVIVTGSRKWEDRMAVQNALTDLVFQKGPFTLVHGACSTGADAIAEDWWQMCGSRTGCEIKRYPANWNRGNKARSERNNRMVKAGADLVLAFLLPDSRNTPHVTRLAREAGIEVKEIQGE